jgi:hypothetical protein
VESWQCQLSSTCAYCKFCPTCQEGPGGPPSGCGYCRFCDPINCQLQCASAASGCEIVNRNVKAEVLVLDVNSWQESTGPNKPARVTTSAECCQVGFLEC